MTTSEQITQAIIEQQFMQKVQLLHGQILDLTEKFWTKHEQVFIWKKRFIRLLWIAGLAIALLTSLLAGALWNR